MERQVINVIVFSPLPIAAGFPGKAEDVLELGAGFPE